VAILTLVIAAVTISVVYPLIANAVTQATSGTVINTSPLTNLQGEEVLLGTAPIVPDMMFLWAYARTRSRVTYGRSPPSPTGEVGKYGRNSGSL
jgi:hypothetical protein